MGIHAHDNQSLALQNTLYAKKIGLNWLDCTITGMGRGPGNTKTEELIKYFTIKNVKQNKAIKKLLLIFLKLKKNIDGVQIIIIDYQENIKFILLTFRPCCQIVDIKKMII